MTGLRLEIVVLLLAMPFLSPVRAQEPPQSFAYVLQAENLGTSRAAAVDLLSKCGRDWIILDVSYDDDSGGRWTSSEIQTIRSGKPGRKVLAYLSIGEAEDYRSYWKKEWDKNRDGKPDPGAPSFLAGENPDWKGNYKVRYWSTDWQALILPELERIVSTGFDGVYLDIVDAFEFFEYDPSTKQWIDGRTNPETENSYREDMNQWVARIAETGRKVRPDFLIIPQNGSQLLALPSYAKMVDGIGIEDLFTDGNKPRPAAESAQILGFLKNLQDLHKPVLTIAYGTSPAAREISTKGALKNNCILLITDRDLKTLGESPAH